MDPLLPALFAVASGDGGGYGVYGIDQLFPQGRTLEGMPFLDDVPDEITEAEAFPVSG